MRIFLAALGLVIGSAGTAADDLVRFAPAFATQPTGLVFHYTAPLEGFAPDSPTLQPPMDNGLSSVLIGGTGVDPLSGLDLDKVEGVLTLGNPPNGVIALFGSEGFDANIEATLLAREFETRTVAGTTVLALGEDNAVSLVNARQPDPFAGRTGRSQRVALGEDFVTVTANWATMERTLSTETVGGSLFWEATLTALGEVREDRNLEAAWGWGGDSFAGAQFDPGVLLDADIEELREKMKSTPGLAFPPFPVAVFALDRSADGVALRIALPYALAEDAQAALDYVGKRLIEFPDVPDQPATQIVEAEGMQVAILTLDYAPEDAAAANRLMIRWIEAVMQRSFAPLQFVSF